PPKPLSGRIGYVTGAAGGIGAATSAHLLAAGAVVMLVDRDAKMLEEVHAGFAQQFGVDNVRSAVVDVTDEQAVIESYGKTTLELGGVDIMVANAGIASAASIEETTIELWRKNYGVLVEGYFLTAREAFKRMKALG